MDQFNDIFYKWRDKTKGDYSNRWRPWQGVRYGTDFGRPRVRDPFAQFMQYDPVGLFAVMANGMADVANDSMRSDLATGRENSFHMGRDTRPNATPFQGWNQRAREFQDMLNREAAIKPQQK